jgi:SAM-dependent methyltransferase
VRRETWAVSRLQLTDNKNTLNQPRRGLANLSVLVPMNRFLLKQLKSKFYNISRYAVPNAKVLDVGVANRSAFEMKCVLPSCTYHALDREVTFDDSERGLIDHFITADLEVDPLKSLVGAGYDLVVINHVLEHVGNGLDVVAHAIACLRPGGTLYIEVPNVRSLSHVGDRWHYHFHDDPTHKRLYAPEQLCNAVMDAGGKIIECGHANTPMKTLLSIPRAIFGVLTAARVGHLFVHSRGAITYLVAQRPA